LDVNNRRTYSGGGEVPNRKKPDLTWKRKNRSSSGERTPGSSTTRGKKDVKKSRGFHLVSGGAAEGGD